MANSMRVAASSDQHHRTPDPACSRGPSSVPSKATNSTTRRVQPGHQNPELPGRVTLPAVPAKSGQSDPCGGLLVHDDALDAAANAEQAAQQLPGRAPTRSASDRNTGFNATSAPS